MKITDRKLLEKPCKKLGYCPYGSLVESFPLKDERTEESCKIFGHDCPVFTCAEGKEVLQKFHKREFK
jgi:hypothetical protein